MPCRRLLLPLLAWLSAGAAERVQAPDAPWRTLRTAHYRIHYPARGGFEPFALEVAAKVEGIHAQVAQWVGYASPRPVVVVIRDPVREANGFAVALLAHPHVVLWRTPPEPDSAVAHVTSWVELLVVHELTHIHHLLRPQDRPDLRDRLLDLPVGPLARKLPRWVTEGYATVIEGRVTGSGRPHSAYRAAVIRQWALEGKLPDYGRLSASEGFRGGAMAYLVGSAYLEWLEARSGDPRILQTLWKQVASPKRRDFEASFTANFGFSSRDGYDRWRAEVGHDALELQRRARAEGWLQEGEVFTRIEGEVADLEVSPDGTRLLARVSTKDFRGLQVWDLRAKDPHAAASKAPASEPVDAPPRVPVRKAAWRLGRVDGAVPRRAAWDGDRVALEIRRPDTEGVLQPRRWLWQPGRATVPAAEPAAPLPARPGLVEEQDGLWVIRRNGRTLVRSLAAAWNPAWTPDGKTLYFARLSAAGVEIRRLDLGPVGAERGLPRDPAPLTVGAVLPAPDGPDTLPAPAAPPAPEPYLTWRNLWTGTRVGAGVSPSGSAWQLGWGGADLLGRASWQVLAGFGDGAGPRGATIGAAWRGWRWAPALELFSSLERPSRQRWLPLAGLDRERRGGELSFAFASRTDWPISFRPGAAFEQVRGPGQQGPDANRSVAGLDSALEHRWQPGERWALAGGLEVRAQAGRTGDRDWNLQRAALRFRFVPRGELPAFGVEAEAGRIGGDPDPRLDRFHLGGLPTSLVPAALDAARVPAAVLPDGIQRGDRFQRFRGTLGGLFRATWEAAAVWDGARERPAAVRTAGLELDLGPLLQGELPAALVGRSTFVVGLHRILSASAGLRGRQAATLSVVVRP